ncbi:hypothetical protein C0989_005557 [Termitomyces sp. Mn162]|nr:hypothetical protein C0989_005557 [Termitomyces sp. Mn162]
MAARWHRSTSPPPPESPIHLLITQLLEMTPINNWHAELLLAEFTYNNTPHSATRVSSFYTNKDYNLQLTLSLKDIPSHVTHKVAKDLWPLHQFLWDEINTTNHAYAKNTHA